MAGKPLDVRIEYRLSPGGELRFWCWDGGDPDEVRSGALWTLRWLRGHGGRLGAACPGAEVYVGRNKLVPEAGEDEASEPDEETW